MFQVLSGSMLVTEVETYRQSHNPRNVVVQIGDTSLYLNEAEARLLVDAVQAELAKEIDYRKCEECGFSGDIHTKECSRHVYNRIRNGESVD